MIIRTTTTLLALSLLAAGALAFAPAAQSTQPATGVKPAAMSTFEKNQSWPLKGRITMEPCKYNLCQDV